MRAVIHVCVGGAWQDVEGLATYLGQKVPGPGPLCVGSLRPAQFLAVFDRSSTRPVFGRSAECVNKAQRRGRLRRMRAPRAYPA